MKKLLLNLDDLAVETFATHPQAARLGTVAGRELTNLCITNNCNGTTICTGAGGNAGSCDGTCYATCGDVNCASYYGQCGTAYDESCAGGDCFNTDNEYTCKYSELDSCSCDATYCC
jgi:hypothetical protein